MKHELYFLVQDSISDMINPGSLTIPFKVTGYQNLIISSFSVNRKFKQKENFQTKTHYTLCQDIQELRLFEMGLLAASHLLLR